MFTSLVADGVGGMLPLDAWWVFGFWITLGFVLGLTLLWVLLGLLAGLAWWG